MRKIRKKKRIRKNKARINRSSYKTKVDSANIAFYQCCTEKDGTPTFGCGYEFTLTSPQNVMCPQCGNRYVKWLNYKDFGENK